MNKQAVVSLMVKQMLKNGSFSICVVKDACEVLGIDTSHPSCRFLRLAHCLKFQDLSNDEIMNIDFHLRALFQLKGGAVLLDSAEVMG